MPVSGNNDKLPGRNGRHDRRDTALDTTFFYIRSFTSQPTLSVLTGNFEKPFAEETRLWTTRNRGCLEGIRQSISLIPITFRFVFGQATKMECSSTSQILLTVVYSQIDRVERSLV